MKDLPGKPIKLNGQLANFSPADFTSTKFATAEDKARWANNFTRFILGGFQRQTFKQEIYKQLSHLFGHCAEYDLHGFYVTWFENTDKRLHWVQTVTTSWLAGIGQPQLTWSDVEIKLIQWIGENHIHDQLASYLQAETEQQERAILTVLQEKYEVIPVHRPDEIKNQSVERTPVPAMSQAVGQLTLF